MAGSGKAIPALAASVTKSSDTPGPCLSCWSWSWSLSLQAVLVAQTLGQPWPSALGQWGRALAGAGAASGLRLGLVAGNSPSSITYGWSGDGGRPGALKSFSADKRVSGGGMSSCWCCGLCWALQHSALEETGVCFGEVKTSVQLF